MKKKRRYRANRIIGKVITFLFFIVELIFMIFLAKTKLLPTKYIILISVVLVLVTLLIGFLLWKLNNAAKTFSGLILALLVVVILLVGMLYLQRTTDMFDNISNVQTEVAQIGIYVRTEDPASSIQDTAGYQFGALSALDRENTDSIVEKIERELGTAIALKEYEGLTDVVDGLLNGEIDALILNRAYMDIVADMEGYEGLSDRVRQLLLMEVEQMIGGNSPSSGNPQEDNGNLGDDGAGSRGEDEEKNENVFSVYISGVDTRSDSLAARSRSDVNILAFVNTETHKVQLISTPRDYYVTLPVSGGVKDKLTHAGIYGVETGLKALEDLYDEDIDYYCRMNFYGFVRLVDALGPITIESDIEFDSKNMPGYHFVKGKNTIDGAAALAFARERYSYASGDLHRSQNQLEIIRAVAAKAMTPEVLLKYSTLMEVAEENVDTNISFDLVADMVRNQLDKGGDWELDSYNVTGTGSSEYAYSLGSKAYVMIPDQSSVDAAKELIRTLKQPADE